MTSDDNAWKTFFDRHASQYMDEPFVHNTVAEVDFLIDHLKLTPEQRVLDVGCGTGRHAVELGRRGFTVTGIDLSVGMLAEAEKAAQQAGVTTVTFQQADATQYRAEQPFDRVYCVCEGALGLIGTGSEPHAHDTAVLRNMYDALQPGGRALITVLNGMRHLRQYQQEDIDAGRFDPLTLTETSTMRTEADNEIVEVTVRERGMVPSELRLLLETIGFQVEHIGGGTAGDWAIRPPKLDEIELMAIMSKPT